jgi:hypothetical protein
MSHTSITQTSSEESPMMLGGNWRPIVIGSYWSAILTGYLATAYMPWRLGPHAAHGDASVYRTMSEQLRTAQVNPLGLRLPTPYLAYFISKLGDIEVDSAWRVVTIGFTFATILAYFAIFAKITDSMSLSCMLTAMIALTFWLCIFNMKDMWLVDPVQNLFAHSRDMGCIETNSPCIRHSRSYWGDV